MRNPIARARNLLFSYAGPLAIAVIQVIVQASFHGSYGYFRDELYYIACSHHLSFGYVDMPPLSIALLALNGSVLGDALQALRFLPSIAGAAVVMLSAMMARSMGGGRFAQTMASLAVFAAPVLMGNGRFFSMNAFDVFFWALAGYIVIRILKDDNQKLWIPFGGVVGLGLLNKYSMGFFCIGLVAGLLLSSQRKHLASKWFWQGAFLAFVLFLPHVIWEIVHALPSVEFMHNASQIKNTPVPAIVFLTGQLRELNYVNAPVWLLGLFAFLFLPGGKEYRALGWMYIVVFVIMVVGHGKVYYLSPVYPLLFAAGAVHVERLTRATVVRWIRLVYAVLLVGWTAVVLPFAIPVFPVERFLAYQKALGATPQADERSGVGSLPQYYADMFGWEEMVAGLADVYRTLNPEEREKCVIFVRNYGEAAAIDFFGPKYGLPNAICPHNNYWLWGPGRNSGDIAIVLGDSKDLKNNLADLGRYYRHVELCFTTCSPLSMPYENGRQFFVCRGANTTFQAIWPAVRIYI